MRKFTPKKEQEMMEDYYKMRRLIRLEKIEEDKRKRLEFKLQKEK
jgi:hypothetical protein